MFPEFVYLASGSPRRRELLQQIGVSFRVIGAAVDETRARARGACGLCLACWPRPRPMRGGSAAAMPLTLRCWRPIPRWCSTAEFWGNPQDRDDALEPCCSRLSGRSHEVLTAVALRIAAGPERQGQPQRGHFSADRSRRSRRLLGYGRTARQSRRLRHSRACSDFRQRPLRQLFRRDGIAVVRNRGIASLRPLAGANALLQP